jgi:lysyl-tRNA synthetase class I
MFVSTGAGRNVSTVRITSVDTHHITYECSDGYRELVDATVCMTLAEKTADWRAATSEEADAFRRRFRPAPENWE